MSSWLLIYFRVALECDSPILEALWLEGPILCATQVWQRLARDVFPCAVDDGLHRPLKHVLLQSQCQFEHDTRSWFAAKFPDGSTIFARWGRYPIMLVERKGSLGIQICYRDSLYQFYSMGRRLVWDKWKPMFMAGEMFRFSSAFAAFRASVPVEQQNEETLYKYLRAKMDTRSQ